MNILQKHANKLISIITLLIGVVLGFVLLKEAAERWLVIVIAVFVALLAYWQSQRIQLHLVGDSKASQADKAQKRKSSLYFWLVRLSLFFIMVFIALLAQSFWWTQQQVQREYKAYDTNDKKADYPLPYSMAWQKLKWQLNMPSLPQLVKIPAGSFLMGSKSGQPDEKPQHQVTLQSFWISATEITFEQYDYYIYKLKQNGLPDIVYPHDEGWGRAQRPVINISWQEAKNYTHWLSYYTGQQCRLPSEAEWEYAARAGSTTDYSWGDNIGTNKANCHGCGSQWDNKQTAPVASFSKNAFGLYDMHGNVWEWVEDKYHSTYQGAPDNGEAWIEGGDRSRVLRGGSWFVTALFLRSSYRFSGSPDGRDDNIGFRIVCSHPFIEN